VAAHTRAFLLLAELAYFITSGVGNRRNAFRRSQYLRISKLNFRSENRARNMHPLVSCGPFQGFSRNGRLIHFFLLLLEVVSGLLGIFSLQSLSLAVFLIFLLA
jgi:hypothetical protein